MTGQRGVGRHPEIQEVPPCTREQGRNDGVLWGRGRAQWEPGQQPALFAKGGSRLYLDVGVGLPSTCPARWQQSLPPSVPFLAHPGLTVPVEHGAQSVSLQRPRAEGHSVLQAHQQPAPLQALGCV